MHCLLHDDQGEGLMGVKRVTWETRVVGTPKQGKGEGGEGKDPERVGRTDGQQRTRKDRATLPIDHGRLR